MNGPCTPAQQRVINALIVITGLDKPNFAHLDDGPRMTITHEDRIYVLEEDGAISDIQPRLAGDSLEMLPRDAPKGHTLLDAIDLDDRLDREERSATGEDYNTVMELVREVFRYGPLLTFDSAAPYSPLRLLELIEGHSFTLNGSNVQLDDATEESLIVRDWTSQRGAHGEPRMIAWTDVKTIHVHWFADKE